IVERKRAVERRDRGDRLLDSPSQVLRERGLVCRDDFALDRELLAVVLCGSPVPGRPLHLDSAKPLSAEARAEDVETRATVAEACEGRDLWLVLRSRKLLPPDEGFA